MLHVPCVFSRTSQDIRERKYMLIKGKAGTTDPRRQRRDLNPRRLSLECTSLIAVLPVGHSWGKWEEWLTLFMGASRSGTDCVCVWFFRRHSPYLLGRLVDILLIDALLLVPKLLLNCAKSLRACSSIVWPLDRIFFSMARNRAVSSYLSPFLSGDHTIAPSKDGFSSVRTSPRQGDSQNGQVFAVEV